MKIVPDDMNNIASVEQFLKRLKEVKKSAMIN